MSKCNCSEKLIELEKRIKNLEYLADRDKCAQGIHSSEKQIIEGSDRIWVRCSICWGDLSESSNIKKPKN